MSNELMDIYIEQSSQSYLCDHSDYHNDADCDYASSGRHDDYSDHCDSDDDRDYY